MTRSPPSIVVSSSALCAVSGACCNRPTGSEPFPSAARAAAVVPEASHITALSAASSSLPALSRTAKPPPGWLPTSRPGEVTWNLNVSSAGFCAASRECTTSDQVNPSASARTRRSTPSITDGYSAVSSSSCGAATCPARRTPPSSRRPAPSPPDPYHRPRTGRRPASPPAPPPRSPDADDDQSDANHPRAWAPTAAQHTTRDATCPQASRTPATSPSAIPRPEQTPPTSPPRQPPTPQPLPPPEPKAPRRLERLEVLVSPLRQPPREEPRLADRAWRYAIWTCKVPVTSKETQGETINTESKIDGDRTEGSGGKQDPSK